MAGVRSGAPFVTPSEAPALAGTVGGLQPVAETVGGCSFTKSLKWGRSSTRLSIMVMAIVVC